MIKPLTISLPDNIAEEAERAAGAIGESLDDFVARAVAFEVERERTEQFFAERRGRANVARALEILCRAGGEPPQPGDEMPEGPEQSR
jgi:hypothetical protein